MAEAYFRHAKRGRFEDEDGTIRHTGTCRIISFNNALFR